MNIAYLISAYKDPVQLKNLVEFLRGDGTHFYIHIDKKVDISPFQKLLPEYKTSNESLTYLKIRVPVYWGGFSQIRYQKMLIGTALNSGIDFKRYVIITGQDFPLVSREKIIKDFSENKEKEYLTGLNFSNLSKKYDVNQSQLEKITLYHFFRDFYPFSQRLCFILSSIMRKIMKLLPIRKKPYLLIKGKKWDVYMSSSYMAITAPCAKNVYNKMNDKNIVRYFRYSFVPEELMIPTIIFNSEFASKAEILITDKYPGLKYLSALTYFNYNKCIEIFTEKNYEELVASKKLFARKFSSDESSGLMKKISKMN